MRDHKKIKLLIITPSLQCGGSEKFVSMVCNHINTALFAVCLVVVDHAKPFYTITNPAIEIVDLGKTRVLFSLPAIRARVKKFGPDIIFSTANHVNLYLAIFKNSFAKHIRFIAREASIVSINSRQSKMPVLYSRLIKKYYHRFDQIICQSGYMQQDLIKYYKIDAAKTTVIHNGVQELTNPLLKAGRQNGDQVYKFITVARLSEEKGIARLIHAVGLLSVPFTYSVIGEGSKRQELQQLINRLQLHEKVFLTGEKAAPFAGMEDADLFLMGSYYEGFPNVLLEAGARGIPVIAFDVPGGIAEIVRDGENGILVADNDLIGFARAINDALAMGFNRQQTAAITQQRFSLSDTLGQLEKLFLQQAADK